MGRYETNIRMSSWGDEVEQSVHTVIAEARVTLDTGFFGKNVVVLAFEVTDDFLKAATKQSER